MRPCPSCKKWTMEFDRYFGRFRCYNPECEWMATSSAEREIRLFEAHQEPRQLVCQKIDNLGLTLKVVYEEGNDALVFDFGMKQPTFDLPGGDGRMIWQIDRASACVAGFTILGAKQFGIEQVDVKLVVRKKESIEDSLRRVPNQVVSGRASKTLIDNVEVTAHQRNERKEPVNKELEDACKEAFSGFETMMCNS